MKILKSLKNGCTRYTIYIVYIFVRLERAHWYTILPSYFIFFYFIFSFETIFSKSNLLVFLYSTEFKKIDVRQVVVTSDQWPVTVSQLKRIFSYCTHSSPNHQICFCNSLFNLFFFFLKIEQPRKSENFTNLENGPLSIMLSHGPKLKPKTSY